MKQTRPYIITALCLQMVLGAILLSCMTDKLFSLSSNKRKCVIYNPVCRRGMMQPITI